MITIKLYWWMLPIVLVLVGWVVSNIWYKKNYSGSWDFSTGILSLAMMALFVCAAIGIIIGHFL